MAREGRGRLSSLDLLPEEAQDDLLWALAQLNARIRTQVDILEELNRRLIDKGLSDYLISPSAFNRKAVAISRASARIKEQRAIFAGIADQLTAESIDSGNVALAEFIKTLIAEIVSKEEGTLTPKGVKELAHAFALVISGTKLSSARRSHVEMEQDAKKKAADAAGAVARKAGLTSATVDKLKAEILGIPRTP